MKSSFAVNCKLIKTWVKAIIKRGCWTVLLLGAYSASVITFSKRNSDLMIHEAADIFNSKIYELVSENLFLLLYIILTATVILLKLNSSEYGVEYFMTAVIGVITIIAFMTHILIS